ncbi:CbtB domain-containing protein [Nocardioides montaniterrae]
MSNTSAISTPVAAPIVSVNAKTVALLVGVAFLALLAYYFIGIDEGAMSLSGKSMLLHEFFHDGRHFMGFPCH